MRRSVWILTFVFLAVLLAFSQTATTNRNADPSIVGAFDPVTGAFTPIRASLAPTRGTIAAAATTFGGKLVFTFTINVKSAVPATDKIVCRASALVIDGPITTGLTTLTQESAAVAATRSGSTANCTVSIPYSWTLNNGSTDQMSLSYGISTSPAAVGTLSLPSRTSGQGLGNFAIPPDGTTTNFSAKATL